MADIKIIEDAGSYSNLKRTGMKKEIAGDGSITYTVASEKKNTVIKFTLTKSEFDALLSLEPTKRAAELDGLIQQALAKLQLPEAVVPKPEVPELKPEVPEVRPEVPIPPGELVFPKGNFFSLCHGSVITKKPGVFSYGERPEFNTLEARLINGEEKQLLDITLASGLEPTTDAEGVLALTYTVKLVVGRNWYEKNKDKKEFASLIQDAIKKAIAASGKDFDPDRVEDISTKGLSAVKDGFNDIAVLERSGKLVVVSLLKEGTSPHFYQTLSFSGDMDLKIKIYLNQTWFENFCTVRTEKRKDGQYTVPHITNKEKFYSAIEKELRSRLEEAGYDKKTASKALATIMPYLKKIDFAGTCEKAFTGKVIELAPVEMKAAPLKR